MWFCFHLFFFFFKQKTAYEMRISDWSSDVCSSDLTSRRNMLNIAWPAVLVLPALPDAAAKVLQVDGPAAVADIERTTVAALHERTSAEIDQRAHRRAEAGIGG